MSCRPIALLALLAGACGTPVTFITDGGGSMRVSLTPASGEGIRFEAQRAGITRDEIESVGTQTLVECPAPARHSGTYGDEEMEQVLEFCAPAVDISGTPCFDTAEVRFELDSYSLSLAVDNVDGNTPEDLILFTEVHDLDPELGRQGSRRMVLEARERCIGPEPVEQVLEVEWAFDMRHVREERVKDDWSGPWY